jgi:hypothetical protein
VFFMIGLPRQTPASVQDTIRYSDHLFQRFDRRVSTFISPMGPFLDPGSSGFEAPERHGYRLFARTLAEHRTLLVQPTWERILNYETEWMTRAQLVDATYDAAEALNDRKRRHGRISAARGAAVARRIAAARRLRDRLDRAGDVPDPEAVRALAGEIHAFSVSTVADKRELFWPSHLVNFRVLTVLGIALRYLWKALGGRRAPAPGGA